MRYLLLVSLLVLAVPTALSGGGNPDARLCMHLIATAQYLNELYTDDLAELTVADIDQDLSAAELSVTGYYAYCILCAYNIEEVSGVEFQIEGWPTGRGAPAAPEIAWEDTTNALALADAGFPFGAGGVVSWGRFGNGCDDTGANVKERSWWGDDNNSPSADCKIYPFAYFWIDLHADTSSVLPIELEYALSSYSYPDTPRVFVQDCTAGFVEDRIDTSNTYGCVLGGDYPEAGSPDTVVTAVDPVSWSTLKANYRSSK